MTLSFFTENCQTLRLLVQLTMMLMDVFSLPIGMPMIIPGVMILHFGDFYVASLQHGWKGD